MIRVDGVTKYHGSEIVLDNVTLHVPKGQNVGLIGPGGAGKSLLTKIICGLVKPDAGNVFVDGEDVTLMSDLELAEFRLKIGMLFQNYALFDFMDVGENIAFPLRQERKHTEAHIQARVSELLKAVDLPGIDRLQINELSGGMKKRVSFARAIIRTPPILIYDDPTAGLDPVTSSKIFEMLKTIQREHGATSLSISHDLQGMKDVCDHWAMIDKGRIIFIGTRKEIESSKHALVREFWDDGMFELFPPETESSSQVATAENDEADTQVDVYTPPEAQGEAAPCLGDDEGTSDGPKDGRAA